MLEEGLTGRSWVVREREIKGEEGTNKGDVTTGDEVGIEQLARSLVLVSVSVQSHRVQSLLRRRLLLPFWEMGERQARRR